MKIYKTKEEIEKDIVNNKLIINDDVKIECDLTFPRVDIYAWNINANNINAGNIDAWDINAEDINAEDIKYYAVCFAYDNIKCKSIKGEKENAKHFCLDGKIIYK